MILRLKTIGLYLILFSSILLGTSDLFAENIPYSSGFTTPYTSVCLSPRDSTTQDTQCATLPPNGSTYCTHPEVHRCGYVGGGTCKIASVLQGCNNGCPQGSIDTGTDCFQCEWPNVYDEISGTCQLYDDCPVGEVPDPAAPFQCIPDQCQAGNRQNITYGTYWANSASDINVSIPPLICIGTCESNVNDAQLEVVYPGTGCGTFSGEEVCTDPTGYTIAVSATSNGNNCSGDTPAPPCTTCGSPPDPSGDPNAPQDPPQPNPPEPEFQEPSGPIGKTSDTVDNGDGTTTTTTTTTYGDGSTTTTSTTTNTASGATSSTTTLTSGQSEMEDGPEQERIYGGGGCGARPLCSGDPIDCAIAGHVWETKCALDSEGVTLDETSVEAVVGDTDLETVLDGGEFDASDPLSLGGYVEIAAPACPADYSINVLGSSFPITWHWVCEVMLLIRPIVMAGGLFLATLIFYRGIVRTE